MIQMFHVYKAYQRDSTALIDVSLDIPKGQFVALTGPSGAGKTTMLQILFCAEQPSEGQVLVDGRNISRLRPSHIAKLRRSIGVVFQDFKLIPNRTVFENVAITLEILGLRQSLIRKRVSMMLRLVGLDRRANSYPIKLSGGEQQRVAIARALINDPKILLADEPTGNLDPELTLEIMDLFRQINLRGTTILIATHDRRRIVEHLKCREIRLEAGRLVKR